MTKKTGKRVKHVPQRTCVGCHQVLPKRTLIRVVRTEDGVKVDLTGKANGRGAYLHNLKPCWERGIKGSLAHALKVELNDEDREILQQFAAQLDDSLPSQGESAPQNQSAGAQVQQDKYE